MLFAPVGVTKPVRIQGAYLSDEEIGNIVSYIKNQVNAEYDDEIMQEIEKNAVAEASKKKGAAAEIQEDSDGQYDSLIDEALNIITQLDTASTTVLTAPSSTTLTAARGSLTFVNFVLSSSERSSN